jgi:hypothetical protein
MCVRLSVVHFADVWAFLQVYSELQDVTNGPMRNKKACIFIGFVFGVKKCSHSVLVPS